MQAENFTGIGIAGNFYDSRRHYWFIVWGLWMKMQIRYPQSLYTFRQMVSNDSGKQECKDFFMGLFNVFNQAENCDFQMIEVLSERLTLTENEKNTILSLNGVLDKMPIPAYTNIPVPVLPIGYDRNKKTALLVDASLITLTSQSAKEMQGMDNFIYLCAKGLNISENMKLDVFRAVRKTFDCINPYTDYNNFINSVRKLI